MMSEKNVDVDQVVKCGMCNGLGYRGVHSHPDTPTILQPIGCWPCEYCQGKGTQPVITYSSGTGCQP